VEEVSSLQQVVPVGIVDLLEQLHHRLDTHFRELTEFRQRLGTDTPVFALEHGLDGADLENVRATVRAAVVQGFGIRYRRWWLPFVVYAAESGYGYVGGEYWQTFADETARWDEVGNRGWIRDQFIKFADRYAGIRPRGAFARQCSIIAWPITHAVLPTYLQRNLAQLLFDFRMGLTSELLSDPEALGVRLASRAGAYTERFRIFCENTSLLGHIAVALLLGDDEESPYLIAATRDRVVADLSQVRESRQLLASARRSASRVRTRGFISGSAPEPASAAAKPPRIPAPTDPKLLLKRVNGRWQAFVALPDLTALNARLPELYRELSTRRAWLEGKAGSPLPRTQLIRSGQEERLATWPRTDLPLIQLEGGSEIVNQLLADQCVLTPGPTWLFRRPSSGPAIEVKGRVVRPGLSYVAVVRTEAEPLQAAWVKQTDIDTVGVRAFELTVPAVISPADVEALTAAGLSVVSDIAIRPVGMVASAWDGEGSIEWLAGERGMFVIQSQVASSACVLTVDGQLNSVPWPEHSRDLFIVLDDLTVGVHTLSVALLAPGAHRLAEETVVITILDPQVRPEGATAGEGIRLLASPARPSLTELFDKRATLSIDGPAGAEAEVVVTLRGDDGGTLAEFKRTASLPRTSSSWPAFVAGIRQDNKFVACYDDAESATVAVSRSGIGFAELTCDRGFRPLRWRIIRQHDQSFVARLIDRTDGTSTKVELFTIGSPLQPVAQPPGSDVEVPVQGGLLVATVGASNSAIILPTQPNKLRIGGSEEPSISVGSTTPQNMLRLIAAYQLWDEAELPADAFARNQQDAVVDSIARSLASRISGNRWEGLETRLRHVDRDHLVDYLEAMQDGVGIESRHKALADQIARRLWRWRSVGDLVEGFSEIIGPTLERSGIANQAGAALFLVSLAGRPGHVATWEPTSRATLLNAVITSPVLMRAARFAVLGFRAYNEADPSVRGF
jgi:hypothetical protein